jgi:serine/threonine protein kinase
MKDAGKDVWALHHKAMNEGIDIRELRNATRGLLEGVRWIHNCGFIHRDLKPQNILVSDTSHLTGIRIIDFGLACEISSKPTIRTGTKG